MTAAACAGSRWRFRPRLGRVACAWSGALSELVVRLHDSDETETSASGGEAGDMVAHASGGDGASARDLAGSAGSGPSPWARSAGNVGVLAHRTAQGLCRSVGSSGGSGCGGRGGRAWDSEGARAVCWALAWRICCWCCWMSMDARSWDSMDITGRLCSGFRCCCFCCCCADGLAEECGPAGSGGNTTRCCCCFCWNWRTMLAASTEKGLLVETAPLGRGHMGVAVVVVAAALLLLGSNAIATTLLW